MVEQVEVTVRYFVEGKVKDPDDDTVNPAGWYGWESECPEEGVFWIGEHRPTAADLKAVCESYVEL